MNIIEIQDDLPSKFLDIPTIAIDTETMGLNINRDRLCLIQINCGDENCYLLKTDDFSKAVNFKQILENKNIIKIFHFARFDVAVLQKNLNVKINNIYCTKIASKIARTYSPKHSLKELVKELLDIDLLKEQQCSYWGSDSFTDAQKMYAANDVIYLHQLRQKLNDILIKENRYETALKCFDAINIITDLDVTNFDFTYIFNH